MNADWKVEKGHYAEVNVPMCDRSLTTVPTNIRTVDDSDVPELKDQCLVRSHGTASSLSPEVLYIDLDPIYILVSCLR